MDRSPLTPRIRTDALAALPVYIRRLFLEVRVTDRRVKVPNLRRRFEKVRPQILEWIELNEEWLESMERRMANEGEEFVDKEDPEQCATFLSGLPPKFLEKRHRSQTQVAIAKLELERMAADILERERHGR